MHDHKAMRKSCDVLFDDCETTVLILVGHIHRFLPWFSFTCVSPYIQNASLETGRHHGRKGNKQEPIKQCILRQIVPTAKLMCATYYL